MIFENLVLIKQISKYGRWTKSADDLHKIMAEARGIDTSDTNTVQQLDHMVRSRFLETSAKTGTNITHAFHDLVKMRKKI